LWLHRSDNVQVVYATAGHPPPVLAAPGRPPVFLLCNGIPLGIFADTTYRSFRAIVSDGALMLLYTDGVIEYDRDIIAGQDRLLEATVKIGCSRQPVSRRNKTIQRGPSSGTSSVPRRRSMTSRS
jgi:serine phosphatase RsbU (regulator of sigma subunit)